MSTVNNFNEIADRLYDEAPSDQAREFVAALKERILAKGDDWIEQNASALEINLHPDDFEHVAPVEDNRLFYLGKWQLALAG